MLLFHVFPLGEVLEQMVYELASQLEVKEEIFIKKDGTLVDEYHLPEGCMDFVSELMIAKVFPPY